MLESTVKKVRVRMDERLLHWIRMLHIRIQCNKRIQCLLHIRIQFILFMNKIVAQSEASPLYTTVYLAVTLRTVLRGLLLYITSQTLCGPVFA